MDKYRETYREEACELLAGLEASLLELEDAPDDADLISRIFRILHTLKGSGSMFGFDDIAMFTHEVEAVFEQVRDGNLPVSKELIDLALCARDQVKTMLAEAPALENQGAALGIVESFRKLLQDSEKQESDSPHAECRVPRPPFPKVTYRIRFQPGPDIFANGTNPVLLLNELREIGDARIMAQLDAIPLLEDIDPEACHTSWDIVLTTSKGMNAIRDVFIFAEDNCDIRIDIIDDGEVPEDRQHYKKLGEILVERGDLAIDDLILALEKHRRIGEILVEEKKIDQGAVESALAEQEHMRRMRIRHQETDTVPSVKVPAKRLDSLVNLVGELVTVQARLTQKASLQKDPDLLSIAEEVERLISELRDETMRIRMLPVGATFNKFRRLVRDLCSDLGKDVVMIIEGGDTELDKTVIEQLNDPLMHIIRNAIDHGMEAPDQREALGKPRQGTIRLTAEHAGANVLIHVSGDGAGLDTDVIRSKAVEKGLISPEADLSEREVFALIFAPGFSTAKKVSGVSGRGVGMDVVKRTIESLRGSVEVSSKKGEGTTITLKMPLTLAIIDGLLVEIGDSYFVLPLSSVEECVELLHEELARAKRRNVMHFRGDIIPYLNLREIFMVGGVPPAIEQIIIAEVETSRIGFGVDRVIGQYQTVIKSLGKIYRDVEGISGATILGDGTVALILDTAKLVRSVENKACFAPLGSG